MKELILIRYGEHTDGHLNELGRDTMQIIAQKLAPIISRRNVLIVCAKVARAEESAQVLLELINVPQFISYDEFYSAEEDGNLPNVPAAAELISNLGKDFDVLIVIASREYIEQLPSYILNQKDSVTTELNRGEVLVIDYGNQTSHKL